MDSRNIINLLTEGLPIKGKTGDVFRSFRPSLTERKYIWVGHRYKGGDPMWVLCEWNSAAWRGVEKES